MQIRALPAERARRPAGVAACCCCCCCCCCLHTIGGVVGAALGTRRPLDEAERRTNRLYWSSFGVLVVLTFLAAALAGEAAAGVFLVLGALPLGQLFTSLIVLLLGPVLPQPVSLPRLGRITWKSTLWAVGGLLLWLVPAWFLLS